MARINIEDSLYKDRRFINLYIRLQSIEAALGALVRAWAVAQQFYTIDDRRIPRAEWDKQGLMNEIIEVGLASEENGRIRVSGADAQFGWLLQRAEAGRKGGLSRGKKSHDIPEEVRCFLRESNASADKAEAKHPPSGANPPSLTLSLTPPLTHSSDSVSDSLAASEILAAAPKKVRRKESEAVIELRRRTWEEYSSAYHARWTQYPVVNAKTRSQIKSLVERVGGEAPDLARFYVRHNDSFFVKDCHPVGLLLLKCEGLLTQMRRDQPITSADVRQLEKTQAQVSMMEQLKKVDL